MIKLDKAFDLFILSRETYCSPVTIWNYNNTLRYFLDWISAEKNLSLDEIDVCDITREDINFYVLFLRKKKKNENNPIAKEKGETITKRSIKTYCTDLRTFFNWLVSEGYVEHSKSPFLNFRMIKPEKKMVIPINADELKIIADGFNSFSALGCRNLCLLHLFIDEGMRMTEVVKLKISDVNFEAGYILVNGKGSKQRVLPLARIVRKYLRRYLDLYRPEVVHDYFFCDTSENPISVDAVRNVFCRTKERSGVDRLHPHLLRHTFATSFIIGGGSLEILRIYMGHADIKTTQNYMHIVNAISFSKNVYQLDPVFFRKLY